MTSIEAMTSSLDVVDELKIGIFSPLRLDFGGGFERFCINFAQYLRGQGHGVTIVTLDWLARNDSRMSVMSLIENLARDQVTYRILPTMGALQLAMASPLPTRGPIPIRKVLHDCDVVYFNNAYALQDFLCLAATRLSRSPPVVSAHHSVLHQNKVLHDTWVKLAVNTFWRNFQAFHALNAHDEAFLRNKTKRRVYTLPIPLNSKLYSPIEKKVSGDVCNVLFLGRLDIQKGVDILVEALRILRLDETPYLLRMTFAGNGPLREQVGILAEESDWVRYTIPSDEEKISLLREADLLIMPSRSESFGIVAGEAMLAGLPVVATMNPGCTELIRDGKTGFLIRELTPVGVAAILERCVSLWRTSPEVLRDVSIRARDAAHEYLDSKKLFPKYMRMLCDVAEAA